MPYVSLVLAENENYNVEEKNKILA